MLRGGVAAACRAESGILRGLHGHLDGLDGCGQILEGLAGVLDLHAGGGAGKVGGLGCGSDVVVALAVVDKDGRVGDGATCAGVLDKVGQVGAGVTDLERFADVFAELVVGDADERDAVGIVPEGNPHVVEALFFEVLGEVAEGFPIHHPFAGGVLESSEVELVLFLVGGHCVLSLVQLSLGFVEVPALDEGGLSWT